MAKYNKNLVSRFARNKKIQIVVILLALVFYPVSTTMAACDAIPSGTGGGGYGAPTPVGEWFEPSLLTCACHCGHAGCCVPPDMPFPQTGGVPVQFLYDGKTCGCGTPPISMQTGQWLDPSQAGKLSKEAVQNSLKESMRNVGKETCSQFAGRAYEETFGVNIGRSTGEMLDYAVPYTGQNLEPGTVLIVSSKYSPTGMHANIFYGSGMVINDPGLSGAPYFTLFSNYSSRIIGVIPPP